MRPRSGRVPVVALLLAAVASASGGNEGKVPPGDETVATVDGVAVTAAQIEEAAKIELSKLRNQEYAIKKRALDGIIARRLLAREASARDIGVNELNRIEVAEKLTPVTDADRQALAKRMRPRLKNLGEEELQKRVEQQLRRSRWSQRYKTFVASLRSKARVEVLLDPPRTEVRAGAEPSRGPKSAPVTIVEFSDFQCPYCARVVSTLKRLESRYGDLLRIEFRDFPLPNHKQAPKAAEAAACAEDQGRFWEMHDSLFANQQKLAPSDLKQRAGELGLDTEVFASCLDSGEKASRWRQDLAEGRSYGVTGTPAYFVNGRSLSGAKSVEGFAAVIDEELGRAGNKPPETPEAKE
jgi:protein-disulfide isomerase